MTEWNNYCMRKFGGSIRKNIADAAIKTLFYTKLSRDFSTAMKLKEQGCWANLGSPLRDTPERRTGHDRRNVKN